jgi:hypothetical protein
MNCHHDFCFELLTGGVVDCLLGSLLQNLVDGVFGNDIVHADINKRNKLYVQTSIYHL